MTDAATLVDAILKANLPGFRIYFPTARGNAAGLPVPELVARCYPGVPLRQPVETMDGIVDLAAITQETGWLPRINHLP
jgi:hypothetical protein